MRQMRRRGRRGTMLVLLALVVVTFGLSIAVWLELRMLHSASAELQRSAAAAALAGASGYQEDHVLQLVVDSVQARAARLARVNRVRGDTVQVLEMYLVPESSYVRVVLGWQTPPLWFGAFTMRSAAAARATSDTTLALVE